ncbi:hypothetical protein [Pelagibaculum spongiae]|uniref:Uncharacterized protein n=1 Tax=Pelagibaculum spongiae TaxID=2080658 RepID=A0A2V1H547_9GAMM|nr:hypothetical protein [Pelagibaculum spongiae]PVZ71895.1 hypothetical protein DC094_02415 [Pelagibaculum spongiae]
MIESNTKQNFAPQHSPEKIRRFKVVFISLAIMVAAVIQFVWFPWFREFADTVQCQNYLWFDAEVNGAGVMFYGLFVGIPAMFASIGIGMFLLRGRKILRAGQDPLPGEKVYFRRRYVFGMTVYAKALLPVLLGVFALMMAFWGYGQAGNILAETNWSQINQACIAGLG